MESNIEKFQAGQFSLTDAELDVIRAEAVMAARGRGASKAEADAVGEATVNKAKEKVNRATGRLRDEQGEEAPKSLKSAGGAL